jgi:DedD protein
MENRLKERLTGAAILVALVVMLVPEMFHGRRGDVAAIAGSSGEGPPVRSYTIDLSNSPTRTGPLQATPASGGSSANDDKPTPLPQPERPSAASSTAAQGASTTRAAASAPATVQPSSGPPVSAVPKADSAAINASSHLATASAHHASSGGWGVQLGLFAKRDNAERLAHGAQAKGFAVGVSNADAKGLYRVYAAGMPDRAAAEAYSQRLRDQGFAAAVVASP